MSEINGNTPNFEGNAAVQDQLNSVEANQNREELLLKAIETLTNEVAGLREEVKELKTNQPVPIKERMSNSWSKLKSMTADGVKNGFSGLLTAGKLLAVGVGLTVAAPVYGLYKGGEYAAKKGGKAIEGSKEYLKNRELRAAAYNDKTVNQFLEQLASMKDTKEDSRLDLKEMNDELQKLHNIQDDYQDSINELMDDDLKESEINTKQGKRLFRQLIELEKQKKTNPAVQIRIQDIEGTIKRVEYEVIEKSMNKNLKKIDALEDEINNYDDASELKLSKEYVTSVVAHARSVEKELFDNNSEYLGSEEYENSPLKKLLDTYPSLKVEEPAVEEDYPSQVEETELFYNGEELLDRDQKSVSNQSADLPKGASIGQVLGSPYIGQESQQIRESNAAAGVDNNKSEEYVPYDGDALVKPYKNLEEIPDEELSADTLLNSPLLSGFDDYGSDSLVGGQDEQPQKKYPSFNNLGSGGIGRSPETRLKQQEKVREFEQGAQSQETNGLNPDNQYIGERAVLGTPRKLEKNRLYQPDNGIRLIVGRRDDQSLMQMDVQAGQKFLPSELPAGFKIESPTKNRIGLHYKIKGFGNNTINLYVDQNDKIEKFEIKGGLFSGAKDVSYQDLKPNTPSFDYAIEADGEGVDNPEADAESSNNNERFVSELYSLKEGTSMQINLKKGIDMQFELNWNDEPKTFDITSNGKVLGEEAGIEEINKSIAPNTFYRERLGSGDYKFTVSGFAGEKFAIIADKDFVPKHIFVNQIGNGLGYRLISS